MRHAIITLMLAGIVLNGCSVKSNEENKVRLTDNAKPDKNESNFRQGVVFLQSRDSINAIKYFKFAADKGHQFAQFKLASIYESRTGKKDADMKEAVKWYQMAAKQGHTLSQIKLGSMYHYGFGGVAVDYDKARQWYSMGAKNGNREAAKALEEIDGVISGGTMTFLNGYVGSYPAEIKLLNHPVLSKRMAALLGDKWQFMKTTWAVEAPIELRNGKFVAEGCMAHNCLATNFIIIYDFNSNTLYAGVREEDIVSFYSENGYTCPELDYWATGQ